MAEFNVKALVAATLAIGVGAGLVGCSHKEAAAPPPPAAAAVPTDPAAMTPQQLQAKGMAEDMAKIHQAQQAATPR